MTRFEKHAQGEYAFSGTEGAVIGTAGREINSVDYALDSSLVRRHEKSILEKITGAPGRRIVMLQQVHGDAVIDVRTPPERDLPWIADADALVTSIEGVCLVIRTADCIPVFILDPGRGILGAAHSGWKGTMMGIARTTTRYMVTQYGCSPGELRAYILPGIGPRSYAVNEDVARHFPLDVSEHGNRLYLDLWKNIERSLASEGMDHGSIFNAGLCTLAERNRFFTHRGGDAGRNLNFGMLLPLR